MTIYKFIYLLTYLHKIKIKKTKNCYTLRAVNRCIILLHDKAHCLANKIMRIMKDSVGRDYMLCCISGRLKGFDSALSRWLQCRCCNSTALPFRLCLLSRQCIWLHCLPSNCIRSIHHSPFTVCLDGFPPIAVTRSSAKISKRKSQFLLLKIKNLSY